MRSLFDFRRTTELIFQRERDREKHGSRDHNTRENIDFATVEKNRNNQSIFFFSFENYFNVCRIYLD